MIDARVPVVLVGSEAALAAALEEGGAAVLLGGDGRCAAALVVERFAATGVRHAVGCACCGARSPAALALDRLFLARVLGACPWFARVVAWVEGEAADAVRAAVRADAVVAARFRLT